MCLAEKVAKRFSFIFLLWLICNPAIACLDSSIELNCGPCSLEEALDKLDEQVDCSFSYNPSQFDLNEKISGDFTGIPLSNALKRLLGDKVKFNVRGRHLLIELPEGKRNENTDKTYVIEGIVKNARTGEVIQNATIYSVGNKYSTLSSESGYYRLEIVSDEPQLGLSYSIQNYFDTIIIVQPFENKLNQDIRLNPREKPLQKMQARNAEIPIEREEVEMLPMVRFLVPEKQRQTAINLDFLEKIPFQASVIPSIGTNKLTSGYTENSFSLNLLSGYNAGVKGIEMGGGVNIIRQDVRGFQSAGVGNIVGGKVRGLQAAGVFNNVRGSVKGLQAGGVYNIVLDTLNGVQAGGVFNILNGEITGAQLGGVFNLATDNMAGLQAGGVFNITQGDVRYAQLAGLFNIAQQVDGVQIGGLMNVSKELKGLQLAGFNNHASDVTGVQIAGFMNTARDCNVQISGFLNVGRKVDKFQLGFINLSDTVGNALGFLTISKKGYRHLDVFADEVHYINTSFRTGTQWFHNIFQVGFGSYVGLNLLSYGYGLGTTVPTKSEKLDITLDFLSRNIMSLESGKTTLQLDNKCELLFSYDLGPVTLIGGPSLHVFIRDAQLQQTSGNAIETIKYANAFPPIYSQHKGGTEVKSWPGLKLGMRF